LRYVLSALRQKFLDLRFVTAGVKVEIVERPGLWMDQDRLAALSHDLRHVAGKTLNAGELDYGVFSGQPERLAASTITVVRDKNSDAPMAFNALAHMRTHPAGKVTDVMHLGLVMVDPDVRSKGLSWILYGLTCILLFLRAGLRPLYVSNVTQVPAVVGMVSDTFSEVEPTPTTPAPRDFRKVLIARQIMADHRHVFGVGEDATFDGTHFVIQDAYTGGSDDLKKTFAEAAKHRDASYNTWCEETLDYARGDDFLQIGKIDLAATRRYVLRSVPRQSLAGLVALGLILVLQRAVLPTLQWLDPKTDFGRLRAR